MSRTIINCFWNGNPINERAVLELLEIAAESQGYEKENWFNAWVSKGRSEESRDFLYEVSNYQLEIVAREI
jgi:hypothetical protein